MQFSFFVFCVAFVFLGLKGLQVASQMVHGGT